MNIFEIILLLAAMAVGGAGVATLIRAARHLKASAPK